MTGMVTPGRAVTEPKISDDNSSDIILDDGQSFVGEWTKRTSPQLVIAIFTDVAVTYKAEFSTNGIDVDSTLTYTFTPGVVEAPKILVIAREFYRITVLNESGSNATFMRLQVSEGFYGTLTSPLNSPIGEEADSVITRAVSIGETVNGDYEANKKDSYVDAAGSNTTLGPGESFDTGVLDLSDFSYVNGELLSDQSGTFVGTFYEDAAGTTPLRTFTRPYTGGEGFAVFGSILTRPYVRYVYTNGPTPQTNFHLAIKVFNNPLGGQLLGLEDFIPNNILAPMGRSVIVGKDGNDLYQNVRVDEFGVLPTANFLFEAARGFYDGINVNDAFGRNPDIDTGSAPEDIWNGGGIYTGMNSTQNENLQTFSSNSNDVGTLVSSGTSDSGTTTTLTDSSATFVTDGVAVGDLVVNDTQGFHGHVTALTETELTVHFWTTFGGNISNTPESGDSYRVITSGGTGAAVVRWNKALNSDYEEITPTYVILNGTNIVTTTGDYFRLAEGIICLAGSNGANVGTITARQATTTANVFASMPAGANHTAIAADTAPAGKTRVLYNIQVLLARSSGAAGSGNVRLLIRDPGGVFAAKINEEITNSSSYSDEDFIVVHSKSEIKWQCADVSDNNTIISASYKYVDYDN